MLPKMSNAISLRKNPHHALPRTFSLKYPGWFEKRQDVRRKLDRINNGIWESEEEQLDYLRTVFGAVGEDLYFLEPVSFVNGKNIIIGDHVFINSNVTFIDAAPIEIGDHTMIAPGCVITTVDHPKQPGERRGFTSRAQAIKIGRDVWIGANCTIFPGVTIGDNVIISSNSVVNKDIPSNTVAFGAPARVHRTIEDDTSGAPGA